MTMTTARIAALAAAGLVSLPTFAANTNQVTGSTSEQVLATQVRKALNTLPYYSVFDNLKFEVKGGQVALSGDVTRPWLKTQAENAVRNVKGVESVASTVNVLPLSNFDDRLRLVLLRQVYGPAPMNKYAHVMAPIRIIVENGHVRLEGVVLNEGDRTIAFLQANAVSGVFSVKNNLKLEKDLI